jgi:hypothetical protein
MILFLLLLLGGVGVGVLLAGVGVGVLLLTSSSLNGVTTVFLALDVPCNYKIRNIFII